MQRKLSIFSHLLSTLKEIGSHCIPFDSMLTGNWWDIGLCNIFWHTLASCKRQTDEIKKRSILEHDGLFFWFVHVHLPPWRGRSTWSNLSNASLYSLEQALEKWFLDLSLHYNTMLNSPPTTHLPFHFFFYSFSSFHNIFFSLLVPLQYKSVNTNVFPPWQF